MIEVITANNISTISKIIHIADVHIRNLRRHTEYEIQFDKLYSLIKTELDAGTIICVAGDIVHTKTDMSPELIAVTSKFLSSLANLAPTIIIAGNHDANLNNPDRLDAISPIVDNLNHKNLFYFKDTGLYKLGDAIFSVLSVFDTPDKFILADDIDTSLTKIALYHGPVTNSVTNLGFNIHGVVSAKTFSGFDYTLLGDIHLHQYLDDNKTIAYPSSLIQQNFGEGYDNHGVIIWDIKNRSSKFVNLDNDYGFHTLTILNGQLVDYDLSKITPKSRVRVKAVDTNTDLVKEIISKLKSELHVYEISIVKLDTMLHGSPIDLSKTNNLDIRNVNIQNNLITEYLNTTLQLDLPPSILEKIYDINKNLNLLLNTTDEVIRNIIWKPKRFEYSNMFSYGENNVIDFATLSGIQGLFGPNASGKSSLLDALCFCLFDTTSRAYKADKILNTKADYFICKFNFEIDGVDYFIEKRGIKNPKGKVKVNIDFWNETPDGQKTILNGEDRRKTSAVIRSYIGTYEDFTLMCLSIQNNNTNFVDKAQTERKEILSKFLDLNILDSLYELANSEYKRLNVLIDDNNVTELENKITVLQERMQEAITEYSNISDSIQSAKLVIADLNNTIHKLTSEIKPIVHLDKEALDVELRKCNDEIQKLTDEVNGAIANQEIVISNLEILQANLLEYDESEIAATASKHSDTVLEYSKCTNLIEKLEYQLESKRKKLRQLEQHEYDPECEFCKNNIFVLDAIATKNEIQIDEFELDELLAKKERLKTILVDTVSAVTDNDKITELHISITKNIEVKKSLEITKLSKDNAILKYQSKILEITEKIAQYNENETSILNNALLQEKIQHMTGELKSHEIELTSLSELYTKTFADSKILEAEINTTKQSLNKIQDLIFERAAYSYYLSAMANDGISYQLMTKALPDIESEINNILSNLVDFNILLYADGKNVDAFMVYGENHWPLELCSGMERFISAIAIRVALINISSLPKPTFFAIDEGLGVLDSTNLHQMYLLFNYIRDVFQFTLIISHIDVVKDMVDNALTVEIDNGFSKLYIT